MTQGHEKISQDNKSILNNDASRAYLLGALLLFVGFGADIPWIESAKMTIIGIRSAMVVGSFLLVLLHIHLWP